MDNSTSNPGTTVIILGEECSERLTATPIKKKKRKSLLKRLFTSSSSKSDLFVRSGRTVATSGGDSSMHPFDDDDEDLHVVDQVVVDHNHDSDHEEVSDLFYVDGSSKDDDDDNDRKKKNNAAVASDDDDEEENTTTLYNPYSPYNADARRCKYVESEAHQARIRGDYERSLELYEQVLSILNSTEYHHHNDILERKAGLYYCCARLCIKLNNPIQAKIYAEKELQCNVEACGDISLPVADAYNDLAYIAQYSNGDLSDALQYYTTALNIIQTLYKNEIITSSNNTKRIALLQQHIKETKKSIGRIHFTMGNMDDALLML